MKYTIAQVYTYVPSQVAATDTYGLLAKHNTEALREKFNKVLFHA